MIEMLVMAAASQRWYAQCDHDYCVDSDGDGEGIYESPQPCASD